MKAILINVENQTIEFVEKGKDYREIYSLIGNDCTTFSVPHTFPNRDALYCDEEGLLKEIKGGFIMDDWSYALVGNALVVGTDRNGNDIDCASTIEELRKQIIFLTTEQLLKKYTHSL